MLTERLTEEQWECMEPIVSQLRKRNLYSCGPWCSERSLLEGILWVSDTGAPWHKLPAYYPPHKNCHTFLIELQEQGFLQKFLEALPENSPPQLLLRPFSQCQTNEY